VLLQDTGWDMGPARTVADAIDQVQPQTLFYWSGGAQAVATAANWSMFHPSIQNTFGISPGTGLLTRLWGPNLTVFHGMGGADLVATAFTQMHNSIGEQLPCKHGNLFCFLSAIKQKHPHAFDNCKGRMRQQIPTIDITPTISITPYSLAPMPFQIPEFGDFKVTIDGNCINCIEVVTHRFVWDTNIPGVNYWPDGLWLMPGADFP
jgi:hypothetical protein